MSYRSLVMAYLKAWLLTLVFFAGVISANALYAQVTMVQPFVPSYNYAIAYTTGCAADLCIPTVYAGLDENADPIYVHHDVEIDLAAVGSGSLVIGMAGSIASVSGPIQDRINNMLRSYAMDLSTLYSWENGANNSGPADVALEGGDCLIKPELVLEEVLFSDCIEAGARLHGNFVGYSNSSPNCAAPSGFLEFYYDNSLFSGPQAEFQWTNSSSPIEACDESELDASIESVGPVVEVLPDDIAPDIIDALSGLLPPYSEDATSEEELRRRLAELYGTTFSLPPYSQQGTIFTDDYEDDGVVDGGTDMPDPPLGGYVPSEPDSEGGNDFAEFCAANPDAAACEMLDDGGAVASAEGFADDVESAIGDMEVIADEALSFQVGDGPSLGTIPETCPLPDENWPLLNDDGQMRENYCVILGGPVRQLIQILGGLIAAIIFIRGVGRG